MEDALIAILIAYWIMLQLLQQVRIERIKRGQRRSRRGHIHAAVEERGECYGGLIPHIIFT
jgi:hypothetical protein